MKITFRHSNLENIIEKHLFDSGAEVNSVKFESYWNNGSQIFECFVNYDADKEFDIEESLKVKPSPPDTNQVILDFIDRYEEMIRSNPLTDNPAFTELRFYDLSRVLQMRLFLRNENKALKVVK